MSKNSKRTYSLPKPEPIITRTKSRRKKIQEKTELPTKEKKTVNTKPKDTVIKIKSPKTTKKAKSINVALRKNENKSDNNLQGEYYPDKLKREFLAKKILLKPKNNYKVIASTNKRKLGVPQKGIQSPLLKQQKIASLNVNSTCSSPELNMQDMVRLIEETRSLSDDDFMEILTCPSPVWWEDPPDGSYIEDSIYTRSPEPVSSEVQNCPLKPIGPTYISAASKNDEKFTKKQRKLENILGSIKNKTVKDINVEKGVTEKNEGKINKITDLDTTEEELTDISFDEDDIINNLENIDIPMEPTDTNEETLVEVIKQNQIEKVNIELPLTKTEDEKKLCNKENEIIEENSSNTVEENEIVKIDDNTDEDSKLKNTGFIEQRNLKKENHLKNKESDVSKTVNDLSEYITVYQIIPDQKKLTNNFKKPKQIIDNNNKMKTENMNGKLEVFFKHSKTNKRYIKPVNSSHNRSADKIEYSNKLIDLNNEENRLMPCEFCVKKTENGVSVLSCDKCDLAPILPCDSCNFLAENREVYKNHISSCCKDVAKISWNRNLVLNQT